MRELIVSEAPLPRIAQLAKDVVEAQGGVVARHTHQATWFDHLRLDRDAWSRSGYLGTYQPFQGKQVRIRVRVWAAWPKRLFRFFVWFGLAQAIVYFSMSILQSPPPPNVWIWSALFTFGGLGVTLLLYSSSWTSSAELEERLVRRLGAEIREDAEVEGNVYTAGGWKEHRAELIEQAVARAPAAEASSTTGEPKEGRLARLRPRRRPKADTDDDTDEAEPPAKKGRLARFKRTKDEREDGPSKRRFPLRRKKERPADADQDGGAAEGDGVASAAQQAGDDEAGDEDRT